MDSVSPVGACSTLFVLVLLVTLAHHFYFPHPKVALIYDSVHYLETCRSITKWLISLFYGHCEPKLLLDASVSAQLLLDGPTLPFIYALPFAIFKHVPECTDWRLLIIAQSVLHAFSACLVTSISLRITGHRFASLLTGIIWGLYPPAVLASGLFLSETTAVFLTLLFAWSILDSADNLLKRVLCGFIAGLMIMLKPVFIPAITISILLFSFFAPKHRLGFLFSTCAVLVATVLPWAAYTKLTTGSLSITVQRCPAQNIAVGFDTECNGWSVTGGSPLAELIADSSCPIAPAVGQLVSKPQQCAKLAVYKLAYLLLSPWNDFRHAFLGLSARLQGYWHVTLIYLSILGTVLVFLIPETFLLRERRLAVNICAIFAFVQIASCLLCEPLSRYNFTSMPFFVIFSGCGLWVTLCRRQFLTALTISGASTGLIVLTGVLSLPVMVEAKEVEHVLQKGMSVEKFIDLSQSRLPRRIESALLLIDGDKGLSGACFYINGHRLKSRLYPLSSFDAQAYMVLPMLRQQAKAMGLSIDDLRQWRLAPFPVSWLNQGSVNRISVIQEQASSSIFGDADPRSRCMPSTSRMSLHKMFASTVSLESRLVEPVLTARVEQSSRLVASPSSIQKLGDSLRMKLLIVPSYKGIPRPREHFAYACPKTIRVRQEDFEPILWNIQDKSIRINKYVLKGARSTTCKLPVPQIGNHKNLRVMISGQTLLVSGPGRVGVAVALGNKQRTVTLDRPVDYVKAEKHWTPFALEDVIPAKVFKTSPRFIQIGLYPCPWQEVHYGSDRGFSDVFLRELSITIEPLDIADLSDKHALFY